jgi:hypothetical protein
VSSHSAFVLRPLGLFFERVCGYIGLGPVSDVCYYLVPTQCSGCVAVCVLHWSVRIDCDSSEEVLTSALLRLRNLRCEAAKVLTRAVEPLMMMKKD